jgi:hypothetical protein
MSKLNENLLIQQPVIVNRVQRFDKLTPLKRENVDKQGFSKLVEVPDSNRRPSEPQAEVTLANPTKLSHSEPKLVKKFQFHYRNSVQECNEYLGLREILTFYLHAKYQSLQGFQYNKIKGVIALNTFHHIISQLQIPLSFAIPPHIIKGY